MKHLDGYRTGEIPTGASEQVAEHLAQCAECANELDALERIAAGVRRMRSSAPAAILETVLARACDECSAVETDLGRVWIAFNPRGISMVYLNAVTPEEFKQAYYRRKHRRVSQGAVPEKYVRMLRELVAGHGGGETAVDLSGLPQFERDVLMMLRRIPRGEVRPYAWVAREAGRPGAVRAVGNAMARNPVPLVLPCHRVVPTSGGVGNYAFGSDIKRNLLAREGVALDELDELARKGVRYIGCRTTGIYCFPTCRDARRVRPANRIPLAGREEAATSGFRPCRHCRP